jgi:hypothetical protein
LKELAMGEIIRLRPHLEARQKNAAPQGAARGRTATILLFLGVRYERHDDPILAPTARDVPRGRRRKRA